MTGTLGGMTRDAPVEIMPLSPEVRLAIIVMIMMV